MPPRHLLALLALLATTACGWADARSGLYADVLSFSLHEPVAPPKSAPCYLSANPAQARWVDSVLASLTLEERIGQLFMVAAYSNKDAAHEAALESQVINQKVGGVIFFQGGPVRQVRITNRLQAVAKIPLMVAIDGEWGLQMRLKDSTLGFPKQMTLGAHPDETLIRKMGAEVARQCKRVGIHVNFAPDIDVNSNPANPVIGMRSFGENKENVALKGLAYALGMQHGGVLACAKHFPGHGDTDADSHFDLPVIKHPKSRIEEIELYPFRRLVQDSVASVMVAHLQIPSLDKSGKPSSLSTNIVSGLLRKQMGFEGLVFTDALNMKGSSGYTQPGSLELAALEAGNDILLLPTDLPKALATIQEAITKGSYKEEDLNTHVRRILLAKWWLGLHTKPAPIPEANLYQDLVNPSVKALINSCYRASITFVKDERHLLPLLNLDTMDLVSISVGEDARTPFQQQLSKYGAFKHFQLAAQPKAEDLTSLVAKMGNAPAGKRRVLVVGLHKIKGSDKASYGLDAELLKWLQNQSKTQPVVVVAFGNPYSLKMLTGLPEVVAAYENEPAAQAAAAQALFGAGPTGGRLPVSLTFNIREGNLHFRPDARRLRFGEPEEAGIDSRKLARLDSMCHYICSSGITPGCQIVVARKGQVVYQRSFGTLLPHPKSDSLSHRASVTDTTLYDIASITKTIGTLQAIMFLQERGLIDITHPIGEYLPELTGSNKADLVLADILTHQAGLQPTLLHWERTLIKGKIGFAMGPPRPSEFPIKVDTAQKADSSATSLQPRVVLEAAPDTSVILPSQPQEAPEPIAGTRLSNKFYCTDGDSGWFNKLVAPGLYTIRTMEDTLWRWTVVSKLMPPNAQGRHEYVYSDVGFYLMKRLAERMLNQPIDEFLAQNFYKPLGLQTLCYNPLRFFDTTAIAPTENDTDFRRQMVRGTVHDPGAALLGGVGGHAGLFSNALDLAIVMQMNMQNGYYGGYQYLFPQTVPYFNKRYFAKNRRGLGWDKPIIGGPGPTSKFASPLTFGHTGFTGTCAWADPKEELVFVFLSNRVCPDPENKRLISENIRPRLQDIVYRAITDTTTLARQ